LLLAPARGTAQGAVSAPILPPGAFRVVPAKIVRTCLTWRTPGAFQGIPGPRHRVSNGTPGTDALNFLPSKANFPPRLRPVAHLHSAWTWDRFRLYGTRPRPGARPACARRVC